MRVIGYKNEHFLVAIGDGDAVVLDMSQEPPLLSPPEAESAYKGFSPFLDDPSKILAAMARAVHLERATTHVITEEQLRTIGDGFKHGDVWVTDKDGKDITPELKPML